MQLGSISTEINLSLIHDPVHGATLVDTGLPGQIDLLATALAEAGLQIHDIKRIILTHHDIDHVGLLHDLVQLTSAQVLAYTAEIPTIDGTGQARFATKELQEQRPGLKALVEKFKYTPVDQALQDGELLDLAGGVRIIATPGHTIGHISIYLERSKTIISGDALTAQAGQLMGPNPGATPDMATAGQSVAKLAKLTVEKVICYHGGLVQEQAQEQLQQVAKQLAA